MLFFRFTLVFLHFYVFTRAFYYLLLQPGTPVYIDPAMIDQRMILCFFTPDADAWFLIQFSLVSTRHTTFACLGYEDIQFGSTNLFDRLE